MTDLLATTAISWGFSAASWLISPVLIRLLNKCFDALGIDPQFQSQQQILLDNLVKLETMLLPKLLIMADAAQQSTHRPKLEKWLQKLKSAFYEAEHVLGIIEYKRLEKEVNSLFPSTSKCSFKKLLVKLPKFSSEKKYLIKSLENLEKIVNEGMDFVPLLNLPSSSGNTLTQSSNEQYRKTISSPGSTVIGREKDRNYIVKLLREDIPESSSNAKCYSVIGIWGMGGLGKTTLAQNIWESAFKEDCPKFGSYEGLQSALQEKLRGERYFLVLDDVWCDKGVSEQEIEQLFVPLRASKRGSKILVTTRNEEVARALGAMDLMQLSELAEEAFLSLFMSHALRDVKVNEHIGKRLQAIGEKIVKKLCRLPLAATTVAGQLRRRPDPEFWSSMLNKSLLKNTVGALFLSYQHLPPALQRCFAFCSLFPKGHLFDHDHLVNLWIVEGFIETDHNNEHMKDTGNQYILELISSSFFQVGHNWDGKYYSMHDLIHDLAQDVSEGEYFRIESGEIKEIPAHTRHIYVPNDLLGEYVEKICKLKYLCTIIVSKSYVCPPVGLKDGDLDALFTKLRKLYVVEIEGISPDVKRVPKSLFQLRNLRYLNLRDSNLEYLNLDAHSELLCYQLRFLSTLRVGNV
ncbi:putative disease resistance protein At3g14460 [Carex rostrata]